MQLYLYNIHVVRDSIFTVKANPTFCVCDVYQWTKVGSEGNEGDYI